MTTLTPLVPVEMFGINQRPDGFKECPECNNIKKHRDECRYGRLEIALLSMAYSSPPELALCWGIGWQTQVARVALGVKVLCES